MRFAGFWRRLVAYFIDMLPIVAMVGLVFYYFLGFDQTVAAYRRGGTADLEARGEFLIERNRIRNVALLVWIAYGCVMDASRFQGTLGKRLLGIRVVDESGAHLSFRKACHRNVAKTLSALPLGLGFLWAAWSKTKQAWHDTIAGCYVVKSNRAGVEPPTPAPGASDPSAC